MHVTGLRTQNEMHAAHVHEPLRAASTACRFHTDGSRLSRRSATIDVSMFCSLLRKYTEQLATLLLSGQSGSLRQTPHRSQSTLNQWRGEVIMMRHRFSVIGMAALAIATLLL